MRELGDTLLVVVGLGEGMAGGRFFGQVLSGLCGCGCLCGECLRLALLDGVIDGVVDGMEVFVDDSPACRLLRHVDCWCCAVEKGHRARPWRWFVED